MLSMEGDHARKLSLHEEYVQTQPQISHDGRWMAYTSTESGRDQVYVRPFPETGKGKWQVSTGGGNSPLWSADGRELFYLSDENFVMVVPVRTEPTLSLSAPKSLFRSIYASIGSAPGTPWDVSRDGKRFLMIKEPGITATGVPLKINIVVNWFEELKQRVPAK